MGHPLNAGGLVGGECPSRASNACDREGHEDGIKQTSEHQQVIPCRWRCLIELALNPKRLADAVAEGLWRADQAWSPPQRVRA